MITFDCALRRPDFAFEATFSVGEGITALFGPSGSGKTTALRLIAGLEQADRGCISIGEALLLESNKGLFLPPHRRRIGLVFQDALLLPHLSVRHNLTYGRWFTPKRQRQIAFEPVVEMLGIGHLLHRRPIHLSGGERQRVAIGRALLTSPRLLLMDEPLASLDAARKREILPFIERVHDEFSIPIIYVSHVVEEVVRLASTIIRLEAGKVVGIGTPSDILSPSQLSQTPERFEALSILNARHSRYLPDYGVTLLNHPAGTIVVPGQFDAGTNEVKLAIRATQVTLAVGAPGKTSVRTILNGKISALQTDNGPLALVTIALSGGDSLKAYTTRLACDELQLSIGGNVQALIKSVSVDERGLPGLRLGDQG